MLGKLKAGSQNGAGDKREAARVGGETLRQAELQIVDSNRPAANWQVGQQVAGGGVTGLVVQETGVGSDNAPISAESCSGVALCGRTGSAVLVLCGRSQDVRLTPCWSSQLKDGCKDSE